MSFRPDSAEDVGYVSVTNSQMRDCFDEVARIRDAHGRFWVAEKTAILEHGCAEQRKAYADFSLRDRHAKPVESSQRSGGLVGFMVDGSHYIGTTESARVKEELSRLADIVRSSNTAGPQRATVAMSDGSGFAHVTVMASSSSDTGVSASVVLAPQSENATGGVMARPLWAGTQHCFSKFM
eukprot:1240620-Prymnesium_polylepis.5